MIIYYAISIIIPRWSGGPEEPSRSLAREGHPGIGAQKCWEKAAPCFHKTTKETNDPDLRGIRGTYEVKKKTKKFTCWQYGKVHYSIEERIDSNPCPQWKMAGESKRGRNRLKSGVDSGGPVGGPAGRRKKTPPW